MPFRVPRAFHPYLKSLWRRLERARGIRRVHFLHVGKTGGSAVKAALAGQHLDSFKLYFHPHRVGLAEVPEGESYVFFVRDPISRYVSGFYSGLRQGQPRYWYPWSEAEREAFTRFNTPDALATALSSEDAELRVAAETAMHSIRHVRDTYATWFRDARYFKSRCDDLLFVGSQERLEGDFQRLQKALGLPADVDLPGDDERAHRRPHRQRGVLSARARENLAAWYATDYRFLSLLSAQHAHLPAYHTPEGAA